MCTTRVCDHTIKMIRKRPSAEALFPRCHDKGTFVNNSFRTAALLPALTAAFALLISAPIAGAAGMKFGIENSSDYIITGFYTGEDGEWSANWMNFKLNGGEKANMTFNHDGACDIEFYVTWEAEDGSHIKGDETTINICDANTIYFNGKEATYD